MASQAFSASANLLKGDPPTRMAGLLIWTGRQEATKPTCPWSPGPLLLSLLITNEKPRSLALHISNSSVAGPTRLSAGPFSPHRVAGRVCRDSTLRRFHGSNPLQTFPAAAPAGLTKRKRHGAYVIPRGRGLRVRAPWR